MEKNILRKIESVLGKLEHFQKYNEVRLDSIELESIKEIYRTIAPNNSSIFITSCGSCVKDAMRVILSYYEREIKKEIVDVTESDLVSDVVVEAKKSSVKRKTTRGKSIKQDALNKQQDK